MMDNAIHVLTVSADEVLKHRGAIEFRCWRQAAGTGRFFTDPDLAGVTGPMGANS